MLCKVEGCPAGLPSLCTPRSALGGSTALAAREPRLDETCCGIMVVPRKLTSRSGTASACSPLSMEECPSTLAPSPVSDAALSPRLSVERAPGSSPAPAEARAARPVGAAKPKSRGKEFQAAAAEAQQPRPRGAPGAKAPSPRRSRCRRAAAGPRPRRSSEDIRKENEEVVLALVGCSMIQEASCDSPAPHKTTPRRASVTPAPCGPMPRPSSTSPAQGGGRRSAGRRAQSPKDLGATLPPDQVLAGEKVVVEVVLKERWVREPVKRKVTLPRQGRGGEALRQPSGRTAGRTGRLASPESLSTRGTIDMDRLHNSLKVCNREFTGRLPPELWHLLGPLMPKRGHGSVASRDSSPSRGSIGRANDSMFNSLVLANSVELREAGAQADPEMEWPAVEALLEPREDPQTSPGRFMVIRRCSPTETDFSQWGPIPKDSEPLNAELQYLEHVRSRFPGTLESTRFSGKASQAYVVKPRCSPQRERAPFKV